MHSDRASSATTHVTLSNVGSIGHQVARDEAQKYLFRPEAHMKSIAFPSCAAELTSEGTVAFAVLILGVPARAEITVEALEDHFGAQGCDPGRMTGVFDAHRHEIQKVARDRLVPRWALGRPVLETDDF